MRANQVEYNCFLVVCKRYYEKWKHKAFVERICGKLEEAKRVAYACEQCDGEEYTVLEFKNGIIKEVK